jgi:hypothetical protein
LRSENTNKADSAVGKETETIKNDQTFNGTMPRACMGASGGHFESVNLQVNNLVVSLKVRSKTGLKEV